MRASRVWDTMANLMKIVAAAGFVMAGILGSAHAADFENGSGASESFFTTPGFEELRVGGFYANPDQKEQGGLIQLEAVFSQFVAKDFGNVFVNAVLRPKLHLGANISVSGDTSAAYTGLTWQLPIYGPLFLEGAFGGAIHNGKLNDAGPNRQQLGCRALFHEAASLGLQFEKFSIMGTVEHMSNAGICDENDGLTNVGLRFGYRF